jgi:hypothetical protein
VDRVNAYHSARADEHMLAHRDQAAQDRCGIDKSGFMYDRIIAAWIFS